MGQHKPNKQIGGHAVVLVGYDATSLRFMNSWGDKWADGGFFKIRDSGVLMKMAFYDVFFLESELKESERKNYGNYGAD